MKSLIFLISLFIRIKFILFSRINLSMRASSPHFQGQHKTLSSSLPLGLSEYIPKPLSPGVPTSKFPKSQQSANQNPVIQDERMKVPTEMYPYSAIGLITVPSNFRLQSTGFLIGKNLALAYAPYLYDFYSEGEENIRFYPGCNGKSSQFYQVQRVLRSQKLKQTQIDFAYQFSVLVLKGNAGEHCGIFALDCTALKQNCCIVQISGYPEETLVNKVFQKENGHQYSQRGKWVESKANHQLLHYEIQTSKGQNGSPIFYMEGGLAYAIGIHRLERGVKGQGLQFTEGVLSKIEKLTETLKVIIETNMHEISLKLSKKYKKTTESDTKPPQLQNKRDRNIQQQQIQEKHRQYLHQPNENHCEVEIPKPLQFFDVSTQSQFRSYVLKQASERRLHLLKQFADKKHLEQTSNRKYSDKINLERNELIQIVGYQLVQELQEAFQSPYNQIFIRRFQTYGRITSYHKDVSIKTMQLYINDGSQYEGGKVAYVCGKRLSVPKITKGTVIINNNRIFHGMTALKKGIIYSLFFLNNDPKIG